jgi:hypothetical protein
MDRHNVLLFVGLLLVAAAIFLHADNGRYAFSQASKRLTYAKLDTRTGEAWLCGAGCLAACYAHMGRQNEAREIVKRLRLITPVVVPSTIHWRNPEHRELFLSALRQAASEKK